MTTKSFSIGTNLSGIVNYFPSEIDTENELVLMYGKNNNGMNTLSKKIISESCRLENFCWIILNTRNLLPNIGEIHDINEYKIPLRYINRKTLSGIFDWDEYVLLIYDYILDATINRNKNMKYSEFFNEIIKLSLNEKGEIKTYYERIINDLSKSNIINDGSYSFISKKVIESIKNNKPSVINIKFNGDKKNLYFILPILSELKMLLWDARKRGFQNSIGILVDNIGWDVNLPDVRRSIHDLFFSWGRTRKVTTIAVQRNDGTLLNELFEDQIKSVNKNEPFNLNGSFKMLFEFDEIGTFKYLNRCHAEEYEINGIKKILPIYYEKVRLL